MIAGHRHFPDKPAEATCPACGISLYVTADGQTGRYPPADWQPGGIRGRHH